MKNFSCILHIRQKIITCARFLLLKFSAFFSRGNVPFNLWYSIKESKFQKMKSETIFAQNVLKTPNSWVKSIQSSTSFCLFDRFFQFLKNLPNFGCGPTLFGWVYSKESRNWINFCYFEKICPIILCFYSRRNFRVKLAHAYWGGTVSSPKQTLTHVRKNFDRFSTEEVWKLCKFWDFLRLLSLVSHVVGVLQIYYLLSCAGGWLSQHCCLVATAILYKSQ